VSTSAASAPGRARLACSIALLFGIAGGNATAAGDPSRGQYLVTAGGCVACHTEDRKDAVAFAGGRALKTPFGTFYGPNLTPHVEAGLGRWSEADFVRAMREGVRPTARTLSGSPSVITRINDGDLADSAAHVAAERPGEPVA
jgi:mono/diheme cytochrome c family protein